MVCTGCVGVWLSLLGGDHILPSLSCYSTGLGGGRDPFLSSQSLAFAFHFQHARRTCKTLWAKCQQFKLAGVSGLVQWHRAVYTPPGSHPIGSLSLRQGNTYQKEIRSIHGERNRSRSNYPKPKSGRVHFDNDSNVIMNNINRKYLRLTTWQAWL